MSDVDWDALVLVGRIARPHGRHGEVIVDLETDFPDIRFRAGAEFYMRPSGSIERATITTVRFHRGRPIIGLDGINAINDAERLAQTELRVPTEALASLNEGVYYRHDLVGCQVTTIGGTTVGVVRRVEAGPGPSRLVVRSAEGDDIEVPFAADICVRVDPPARSIVIDPPEGLLDLNRK